MSNVGGRAMLGDSTVTDFQKFCGTFKTFRMQNDDMVIFFLRSFRKVRF